MDFLRVIGQLNEHDLYTAQLAIQGRVTLNENRRFLDAAETYLALGCRVIFVERDGDGLYRREGIVVGYTATRVRVRFERTDRESLGPVTKSVPWRELSSCRT